MLPRAHGQLGVLRRRGTRPNRIAAIPNLAVTFLLFLLGGIASIVLSILTDRIQQEIVLSWMQPITKRFSIHKIMRQRGEILRKQLGKLLGKPAIPKPVALDAQDRQSHLLLRLGLQGPAD